LIYWAGGNPFHHHQDLNRLRRAWQKPETIIVHESWWTPTARHADIVLPATTTLERNDVGGSSRDRFVFAMHRGIEPQAEARSDFDIFRALAARLGYESRFTEDRDEMGWCRWIYDHLRSAAGNKNITLPEFESFWAKGFVELPPPDDEFVLFEDFRHDPDLYPLQTPSGKIEIGSETIASFGYADCPSHPAWLPPAEWLGSDKAKSWPLHLVTHQPADRLHSQMDPGPLSRSNKVHGREQIRLNERDAVARGIKTGDVVRVFNERGACLAAAHIDNAVTPNVVMMATGAWFDPAAAEGAPERHGNPNVLTLDVGTSQLAQGPSALSALVQIERWDAPPDPIRAWDMVLPAQRRTGG
jgi:biotin/methionine sulfoxide reductase